MKHDLRNQIVPILTLAACLIVLPGALSGQSGSTHSPIRLEKEVPPEVRSDLKTAARSVADQIGNSSLSKDEKDRFAYSVAVNLRLYHLSSALYYDGYLYDYVNKVAANVLKNDPNTAAKVRVYVSRSTQVNALTLPDGSILVNLGLLTRLENEAQLALVISHEIAHYQKKHGLRMAEQQSQNKLSKKELEGMFKGTNNPDKLLRMFSFSRQNELQADEVGMEMFLKTDYDPQAALGLFDVLKNGHLATDTSTVNLFMFFKKRDFEIDSTWVRSYNSEELKPAPKEEKVEEVWNQKQPKKAAFKIDEKDMSTHPDAMERQEALQVQLSIATKPKANLKAFVQPEEDFRKMQELAEYESGVTWGRTAAYYWGLYRALRKFEESGDHQYFIEQAAQNLFWIYHIRSESSDLEITSMEKVTGNPGFANLVYFVTRINKQKLGEMISNFVEEYSAEYPKSETLLILTARMASALENKEKAKTIYQEYLEKFPQGVHVTFSNYQIKHGK